MPSPSSRIPATFHFEKHHINAERLDLDCTQAWEVYLSTADDWFQFVFDRAMLREPRGRHRRESAFEITPMPVDKPVLYKMPKHIISDTLKIYIVREFATLKDRDEVPGLLRQFSKLCRYNATPIDEFLVPPVFLLWLEHERAGKKILSAMMKEHKKKEHAAWKARQEEKRTEPKTNDKKKPRQRKSKHEKGTDAFASLDNPDLPMVVKAGYDNTAPRQETTMWQLAAAELGKLTSDETNKSGLYLIEDPYKDPDDTTAPKAVFAWVVERHIKGGEASLRQARGKCLRFPQNATEQPPIVPHCLNRTKPKGRLEVPVSLDFFLDDQKMPCKVPHDAPVITYEWWEKNVTELGEANNLLVKEYKRLYQRSRGPGGRFERFTAEAYIARIRTLIYEPKQRSQSAHRGRERSVDTHVTQRSQSVPTSNSSHAEGRHQRRTKVDGTSDRLRR